MNNEEAKFLLSAFRANGQDEGDPCFGKAIDLLQTDSELKEWFVAEMDQDLALIEKLKGVPVPNRLKQDILSGRHVMKSRYSLSPGHWLALAAAVAFLITVSSIFFPARPQYDHAQYAKAMSEYLSHQLAGLEIYTDDFMEIQRFLRESGLDSDIVLPAGLHNLPGIGCRILTWEGQKVALICFRQEDKSKIHLLVMDKNLFPEIKETPAFAKVDEWTMASWTRDSKNYLLAGGPGLSERL